MDPDRGVGAGYHCDALHSVWKKPEDPPMGRCGLLAYRCEFQTGTEHLSVGGPPYPERLSGGGVQGGASCGGRAEKDDLRLWTMLL